jgi:hypothetical protein
MKRMLFLRTAWMKKYEGVSQSDKPSGGGSFVKKHGWGGEIFNFRPLKGKMYGYVRLMRGEESNIAIDRIGAQSNDEYIDNVLVVWVATRPEGGTYIVGWYSDARVYNKVQEPSDSLDRWYNDENINYRVTTDSKKAKRLEEDERIFPVEGMGHSNLWYAEKPEHEEFKNKVLSYVFHGKNPAKSRPRRGTIDPERRVKIEKTAVEIVKKHYLSKGYEVSSVEKDNMGWDLEATYNEITLRIEVKGLSGKDVNAGLTPNEYEKMTREEYWYSYRIAVVTHALEKEPVLRIFSYSVDNGKWEDEKGTALKIEEIVAANITI